jgi:glycosyltransferase involved in cell wall biosynthesis
MMMPLIFWQNIPSIHQAPMIRAVARQWDGEVLVVTEADVLEDRLGQGWGRPDFSSARLLVAPAHEERQRLVSKYGIQDSVHIFSGLHAYPATYWTFKQVSRTEATIGVFVEAAQVNDGFRTAIRLARYKLHALRWRRRLDFLLATGISGPVARRCGFRESRIYRFGYFVECHEDEGVVCDVIQQRHNANEVIRLLFVGQLIARKGLDLLLHALARLHHRPWRLDVVGKGPLFDTYKAQANLSGIGARVCWLGTIANPQARSLMAQADVLVLPSRYDGWGAVVNEALMAGTPVIISDACGAADLVSKPWRGNIFPCGDVEELVRALQIRMELGPVKNEQRERICTWASQAICPEVAQVT